MCVNAETELGLFEPVKLEPDAHTFIMKILERNHRKKKKEEDKEAAAGFGRVCSAKVWSYLWFWCSQNGLLRLIRPGLGRYVIWSPIKAARC